MKKTKLARIASLVIASMLLLSCSVFAESESAADAQNDQLTKYTDAIMNGTIAEMLQEYENHTASGAAAYTAEGIDTIMEISTVNDLKDFADSVNAKGDYYEGLTVELLADLQWDSSEEWVPLKNFKGTFKGNGHTISDLGNPFISYITLPGTVQGLTVKSDISKDGNVGGIAEINTGVIKDCKYSGTITSEDHFNKDTTGCGGIAGINSGQIIGCSTADGSVLNRTGYLVGGIAGLNISIDADRSDAGIFNCINNADVNCFKGTNHSLVGAAGGIAGVHSVEVDASEVEKLGSQIKSCENYGNVTSEGSAAAGIIGIAVDGKIEGCSNAGTITQKTSGLWAAGIVASMDQHKNYKGYDDTSDLIYVKNCSNSGNVTGITRTAGIVGGDEPLHTVTYIGYVESCINTGDILSNGYTGGISGYNQGSIRKSFNTGYIKTDLQGIKKDAGDGWNAAGGIAALTSVDIQNCINIGTVSADVDEPLTYTAVTGGIAGKFAGGTITNCYSSAPVTGNHTNKPSEDGKLTVYYGGIAGEQTSGISIQNCVFNDGLDSNKAKRAIASDLTSDKGLDLSEMTGKDPAASVRSLVESGAYEYADDINVNGTRYQLTPYLKGMTALYAADPETVLAHAAYAVQDSDTPVPGGSTGGNDASGSAKNVDTGDDFPFVLLAMTLLLSAAAGAGALFVRKEH